MVDRQDIDALLIGSLYGELSSADEARLRAHLESHPADRSLLDDLSHARTAVRESRILQVQHEPPQSISALLLQEAARRAPRKAQLRDQADEERVSWFVRLRRSFLMHPAMAAAAMLVVVIGVAGTLYVREGGQFAAPTASRSKASSLYEEAAHAPSRTAPAATSTAARSDDGISADPEAPASSFGAATPPRERAANAEDVKREASRTSAYRVGLADGASSTESQVTGQASAEVTGQASARAPAQVPGQVRDQVPPVAEPTRNLEAAAPRAAAPVAPAAPAAPEEAAPGSAPKASPSKTSIASDEARRPPGPNTILEVSTPERNRQPKDLDDRSDGSKFSTVPAAPTGTPRSGAPSVSSKELAPDAKGGAPATKQRSTDSGVAPSPPPPPPPPPPSAPTPAPTGGSRDADDLAKARPSSAIAANRASGGLGGAAPPAGGEPAPAQTTQTAELAWAKNQHSRLLAQVQASNCKGAATTALALSTRAPAYYEEHVENHRDIAKCLSYINDQRERAAAQRARTTSGPAEERPAPSKPAASKPAAKPSQPSNR